MSKTCVKQCYGFATLYRRRGEILNTFFNIPIIFCHWLIQSLKLWLNLWSLRWLKPNCSGLVTLNQLDYEFCIFHYTWVVSNLTFFSWTLCMIQITFWFCLSCSTQYIKKNKLLKSSILTLKFSKSERGRMYCSCYY